MSLRQAWKRGRLVRSLAAIREELAVNRRWHNPRNRERLRTAFASKSAELVELELTYWRRAGG